MGATVSATQGPGQRVQTGFAGTSMEEESGDLHLVAPFPLGILVALVDGLGHGPEAACAARAAIDILREHAEEPVLELFRLCHEGLRKTRGAAMSLAAFDSRDASLSWAGVGNVEGVLVRANPSTQPARDSIPLRGGVVGFHLPALRPASVQVQPGDALVMVTDGVQSDFNTHWTLEGSPEETAQLILSRYAKGSDDAHVIVVKFPEDRA
jgi:negative regulator of sigma-B (phosphoserine phosphatase)